MLAYMMCVESDIDFINILAVFSDHVADAQRVGSGTCNCQGALVTTLITRVVMEIVLRANDE